MYSFIRSPVEVYEQSTTDFKSLAQELKNCCIYDETKKNYVEKDGGIESAKIFHKMALHLSNQAFQSGVKREDQFMCIIQAVGLLNAAICRNPSNLVEIENLRQNICKKVIRVSNAKNETEDLVKIAQDGKQKIEKMRRRVKCELDSIKKISQTTPQDDTTEEQKIEEEKIESIRKLNEFITSEYKALMKIIWDKNAYL